MKVLFIGGTGLISTAVSQVALERKIDLYVLNRGNNNDVLPDKVKTIICDINNDEAVKKAIKGHKFDAIVDWIAFTVDHVKRDYRLFKNKTKQYVFISSASAYKKPLPKLPITEDIPLDNPYWQYSQNKKYCEEYLLNINDPDFNVTIIRPSHTYDETLPIFQLSSWKFPFTILNRIIERKPIVLPDDGESLWTVTYNYDFAEGFLDVLGNELAYNDYFHLTSNKVYSWNQIAKFFYEALEIEPNIIHIPSEYILRFFPEVKGELYGDKKDSAVFDNSKIKSIAPNYKSETEYYDIVKIIVKRYLENAELQNIDAEFNQKYDKLIQAYQNENS
ncbi:MAG: NAD-dependent epimerase/dehydratase family protein [Candidatus Izimaplasma sp.]|nr:NAD-dependent epimerase/dehydratase family protein [Candidatus Izimaplasma bacterium]